jgi:hypothetical protein
MPWRAVPLVLFFGAVIAQTQDGEKLRPIPGLSTSSAGSPCRSSGLEAPSQLALSGICMPSAAKSGSAENEKRHLQDHAQDDAVVVIFHCITFRHAVCPL